MPKIEWRDRKITISVPAGCDFQKIACQHPELLKFGCKRGECGVCAIRIVEGMQNLTKHTPEERSTLARKKLPSDCRLACQCMPNGRGDIAIDNTMIGEKA